MSIQARLNELGIVLPHATAPLVSYVPVVVVNNIAHVSGQLPFIDGQLVTGRMGEGATIEEGAAAARACALMILAQLEAALIPLDRVGRVVKLGAFVNSTPDFVDQPKVANGASDLMLSIFGAKGKHARSAVGVPSLPLGALVEVDALICLTA